MNTSHLTHWWSEVNVSLYYHHFTHALDYAANFKSDSEDYILSHWRDILLIIIIYLLTSLLVYLMPSRLMNQGCGKVKRALLVIAHPDDECMFFGPVLVHLTKHADVFLICFSYGDYYGKGCTRKKELYESCRVLGVRDSNITILKYTEMPDGPDVLWNNSKIAQLILHYVELYSIDTLLTFDRDGVSYHENHAALYKGIALLNEENKIPSYCSVYLLNTVNIVRKYSMFFDTLISFLTSKYIYLVTLEDHMRIVEAMTKHSSQFVWFRRLFIHLSHYAYINTFKRMKVR